MESSEVKACSESTEIGSNILIDVLGPRSDNQTLKKNSLTCLLFHPSWHQYPYIYGYIICKH
jgi:hypothetical protein